MGVYVGIMIRLIVQAWLMTEVWYSQWIFTTPDDLGAAIVDANWIQIVLLGFGIVLGCWFLHKFALELVSLSTEVEEDSFKRIGLGWARAVDRVFVLFVLLYAGFMFFVESRGWHSESLVLSAIGWFVFTFLLFVVASKPMSKYEVGAVIFWSWTWVWLQSIGTGSRRDGDFGFLSFVQYFSGALILLAFCGGGVIISILLLKGYAALRRRWWVASVSDRAFAPRIQYGIKMILLILLLRVFAETFESRWYEIMWDNIMLRAILFYWCVALFLWSGRMLSWKSGLVLCLGYIGSTAIGLNGEWVGIRSFPIHWSDMNDAQIVCAAIACVCVGSYVKQRVPQLRDIMKRWKVRV